MLQAKAKSKLTDVAVKRMTAEGRYPDGDVPGLYLRIVGGSKAWVQRITINGKRCDIGLGPYPAVSIADARGIANGNRTKVKKDRIDPLGERRADKDAKRVEAAKAKTFEECAKAYLASKKAEWKNEKHAKQWEATLDAYAYPIIGKLPVASIDTDLVCRVLEQPKAKKDGTESTLWLLNTETASRVRGRIEQVLDWAKVRKYRDGENPALWRGHLDKLLPKRSKVQQVKHRAALPHAKIGAFMVELAKRDGISPRALEFGILCASRSGEIRGATWGEIDLDAKLWTIPADRMKAKKLHIVPLSDAAVELLMDLPGAPKPGEAVKDKDAIVFPAPRGGAMSDMALTAVLKRMGHDDLTQHGFRSTFREWVADTGRNREAAEHALAHVVGNKVEASYHRETMVPQRIPLMQQWADYCATVVTGDNVVSIAKASA